MSKPDPETNNDQQLHYKEIGHGPPLVILHGLLGSSNNWQTVGRTLSNEFRVLMVDQRNHGRSFHSTRHTYRLLAEDLLTFLDLHRIDEARLLGHSMGGKAAMTFALSFPDRVSKLVVVDIAPRAYPPSQDEILDSLSELNLGRIFARTDADRLLALNIHNQRVRQFLLTNLKRNEKGGFGWRVNLSGLRANRLEMTKAVEFSNPCSVPSLFIRGENSAYIDRSDLAHIRRLFPAASFRTIQGAGHWVHADAPQEFIRVVREFL